LPSVHHTRRLRGNDPGDTVQQVAAKAQALLTSAKAFLCQSDIAKAVIELVPQEEKTVFLIQARPGPPLMMFMAERVDIAD
jgi:hypothetical protein